MEKNGWLKREGNDGNVISGWIKGEGGEAKERKRRTEGE